MPRRTRSCSEVMVCAVCLTIADEDSVSAGAGSSYVPVTLGVYCMSSRENSHCVAATSAVMVMVETGEEDVSVVWGIMHMQAVEVVHLHYMGSRGGGGANDGCSTCSSSDLPAGTMG